MTTRRHTIALRLTVGLTVGTALLWLGAATISAGVLQNQLNEAFDDSLRQGAARLLPLAMHDLREPMEPLGAVGSSFDEDEKFFTYVVRAPSGTVILRDEDAPDVAMLTGPMDGFGEYDGRRTFSLTDHSNGYAIVVMEALNQRSAVLSQSMSALVWPLAALIPLIGLGIWLALRLALRPLDRLRQDIAKRDSHNLAPLTAEGHPAELAPIAEEVASLLARLRTAMDAERAFAANSAHELRTPIAGALAQTQQLALELQSHPKIARVQEIERSLRHLAQLAEKLLQLARLEAGFAKSETPSNLRPALNLVVRDFQSGSAATAPVELAIAPDADLVSPTNPDAFVMAIRNLIQNALVHGTPHEPVKVYAGPGPVVRVVSAGPKVAPQVLSRLGKRFVRGETSATGTGLGLTIVRSILEQTGGALTLLSPASGRNDGFEAVAKLGKA